ncbi:hypothetical protein WJX84_011986, partial [Apatococcus fuscideae]
GQRLYQYTDPTGKQYLSALPPAAGGLPQPRTPFFYTPMVVEEGMLSPHAGPPSEALRRQSIDRARANGWRPEELVIATGAASPEQAAKTGYPSPMVSPPMSPMQSPRTSMTGGMSSAEPAWLAKHPMHLLSAYNELLGGEPPYTSCHGRFIGTVDFMWFTPEMEGLRLRPRRALLPPPLDSLHCGLPSPTWPSDHISLLCDFQMLGAPMPSSVPVPTPPWAPAFDPSISSPETDVGLDGVSGMGISTKADVGPSGARRASTHLPAGSGRTSARSHGPQSGHSQQAAGPPSGSAAVPIGAVHSFQHARFVD